MALLSRLSSRVASQIERANRLAAGDAIALAEEQTATELAPVEMAPDFLKRALDAHDRRPEEFRSWDGYLHVSSLIGMCPRKIFLIEKERLIALQHVTGAHRVMWAFGRAVEQHVRRVYIEARQYRGILGRWSCVCGHTTFEGERPTDPPICERCRGLPDHYGELTLVDEVGGIKGHPDMPVVLDDGSVCVTEIKSITGEEWKDLTAPKGDHIFQAAGYRRLFERNGQRVSPHVIVLYTNKHFQYGSPYKEFHVDVTAPQWQQVLDRSWEAASMVREAIINNRIPARLCEEMDDRRAKACVALTSCFSRTV